MPSLTCSSLGTPECGFVAQGDNDNETVQKMIKHAKIAHAEKIKGKSDEDLVKMMMPKVTKDEACGSCNVCG